MPKNKEDNITTRFIYKTLYWKLKPPGKPVVLLLNQNRWSSTYLWLLIALLMVTTMHVIPEMGPVHQNRYLRYWYGEITTAICLAYWNTPFFLIDDK